MGREWETAVHYAIVECWAWRTLGTIQQYFEVVTRCGYINIRNNTWSAYFVAVLMLNKIAILISKNVITKIQPASRNDFDLCIFQRTWNDLRNSLYKKRVSSIDPIVSTCFFEKVGFSSTHCSESSLPPCSQLTSYTVFSMMRGNRQPASYKNIFKKKGKNMDYSLICSCV